MINLNDLSLFHGDCLKVMKSLPARSVSHIITDPPFNMVDQEWDTEIDLEEMWYEFNRVTQPRSAILIFGMPPFSAKVITSNPRQYRYNWYWRKSVPTGHQFSGYQPRRELEEIMVFAAKSPEYHPPLERNPSPYIHVLKSRNKSEVYGGDEFKGNTDQHPQFKVMTHKNRTNLLEFATVARPLVRTQKPVPLLRFFLETYSQPGDVILDPFLGSGSLAVAGLEMGRKVIGIEKNPKHYCIALKRLYGIDQDAPVAEPYYHIDAANDRGDDISHIG